MIRFDCTLDRPAFRLDAAFEAGSGITALFGPSGSGKSTVIRLLAGLERPERGWIEAGGSVLLDTGAGVFVPPHRRRIGLVFQDALLLPHLSVRANLTYGRWFTPTAERRISLDQVVQTLGIAHLMARAPANLSGGERQRVAIGRALLASPRLLLMDEPLASLDAARKQEILPFIERLRDEFAIPVVYVSHAVEEIARLADRVVRIENGLVAAQGTPAEALGQAPPGADRFDLVSILTARVRERRADYAVTLLDHPAGQIVVPADGAPFAGQELRVAVRATDVTLAAGAPGPLSVRTILAGRIAGIETGPGPFAIVTLTLDGGDSLKASATRLALDELRLRPGDQVQALVKTAAIHGR